MYDSKRYYQNNLNDTNQNYTKGIILDLCELLSSIEIWPLCNNFFID